MFWHYKIIDINSSQFLNLTNHSIKQCNIINKLSYQLIYKWTSRTVPKQLHPAKGQLKKRMECYPAGVESRNTGWSGNKHPLRSVLLHIMEKGCFAGAGFTRQKNIAASVLNEVVGKLQFMVCGGHGFLGYAHS